MAKETYVGWVVWETCADLDIVYGVVQTAVNSSECSSLVSSTPYSCHASSSDLLGVKPSASASEIKKAFRMK